MKHEEPKQSRRLREFYLHRIHLFTKFYEQILNDNYCTVCEVLLTSLFVSIDSATGSLFVLHCIRYWIKVQFPNADR